MLKPKSNVPYTRTEIQGMRKGELQSYLPQNGFIIRAGCFTIEKMNPDAPFVIQVGNAPKVVAKAELLRQQPDTVFPVFLKEKCSDRHYFFEGNFRFSSLSKARTLIAAAEDRSGRHGELAYVLRLQRV